MRSKARENNFLIGVRDKQDKNVGSNRICKAIELNFKRVRGYTLSRYQTREIFTKMIFKRQLSRDASLGDIQTLQQFEKVFDQKHSVILIRKFVPCAIGKSIYKKKTIYIR